MSSAAPAKKKTAGESAKKKTARPIRAGPTASATQYPVGTKRKGGDGRTWVVKTASNGTLRWVHLARKGPTASATKFAPGTKKRGGDGNMWVVKAASNGVHRWVRVPTK
jgi:hypothetical protein